MVKPEDVLALQIQVTSIRLILQDRGVITRDEYLDVAMKLVSVVQSQFPSLDWPDVLSKIEGDI